MTLLLLVATAGFAPMPTAADLIAQTKAAYHSAKSYRVQLDLVEVGSGRRAEMHLKLKTVRGAGGKPTMGWVDLRAVGPRNVHNVIFDNGTGAFSINPEKKRYAVTPHQEGSPEMITKEIFGQLENTAGLKLSVVSGTWHGRSTYFLTGKDKEISFELGIDKATRLFVESHTISTNPARDDRRDVTFSNQEINVPIPISAFKWTPPAGYAKVTVNRLYS